eukprot:3477409-Pleurochrysis_carterae.AAC.1
MSVIVRLPPELVRMCGGGADVRLYCKGADSVLLELLDTRRAENDAAKVEAMATTLDAWADMALRTLLWAKRELPEYAAWEVKYRAVSEMPDEIRRLKLGEPNKITALQAEVECKL